MKISRKLLAVAAAGSLTLGMASCSVSGEKGAKEKTADTPISATNTASSEIEKDNAKDLPKDVQTLWQNEGGKEGPYGDVVSVKSNDKGETLVQFAGGQYVSYSKEFGAVPVIGMIAKTWVDGGALNNEIGVPTAPEKGTAKEGWTQSFAHGVIEWSNKDGKGYTSTITRM